VSYDEVVRFKQSALQDEVSSQSTLSPHSGAFMQWVADNINHDSCTTDGHGSFHGMGVIAISTKTAAGRKTVISTATKRSKRLAQRLVKKVTAYLGLEILTYVPERNGMSNISFGQYLDLLSKDSLRVSLNIDLLRSKH